MPRAAIWQRLPFIALAYAAVAAALMLAACGEASSSESTPTATPAVTVSPSPTATATPAATFTSTATPTATPTAAATAAPAPPAIPTPVAGVPEVGLLAVIDKQRPLPDRYIPPNLAWIPGDWLVPGYGGLLLRSEAIAALGELREAALAEGLDIRVRSAYRSYEEQVWTFAYWIDVYGSEEEARRWSAPPGHSEHQLGSVVDLTSVEVGWELDQGFAGAAAGQWLAAHAHEYGFALSYPADGEAVTGYAFEPWHFRYIGVPAAQAWRASGMTLVEFLERQ